MNRDSQAERGHVTRRETIRMALTSAGMDPDVARRWCDAWEAEAALQGLAPGAADWEAGRLWIDAQCKARTQPPN